MKKPESVTSLENLGRVRLSESFFMREMLYSEIANFYAIPNIPDYPDVAIEAGTRLCAEILEPLRKTFGSVAVRSAYRSPSVNQMGNEKGHNCASNESNYAHHIWDYRDSEGCLGAMACIVIPWFADRYEAGADWRAMAWWIHDHLPYSSMTFFPKLAAFNIGWRDKPKREIHSYIEPKGCLTKPGMENQAGRHVDWYREFPDAR